MLSHNASESIPQLTSCNFQGSEKQERLKPLKLPGSEVKASSLQSLDKFVSIGILSPQAQEKAFQRQRRAGES